MLKIIEFGKKSVFVLTLAGFISGIFPGALAQSLDRLERDIRFDRNRMLPYLETAGKEESPENWYSVISQGILSTEAEWRIEVDREIEMIVNSENKSDPVIDADIYKSILLNELLTEKRESELLWESEANLFVEEEITKYLEMTASEDSAAVNELNLPLQNEVNPLVLNSGETFPLIDEYNKIDREWKKNWDDLLVSESNWIANSEKSINDGIDNWNYSIDALKERKENRLNSIEETKISWENNKLVVETAEEKTRTYLKQAVENLKGAYDNSISGDSQLNPYFGELNTLLEKIDAALLNHVPLEEMAKELSEYFSNQSQYASGKKEFWQENKLKSRYSEPLDLNFQKNFSLASVQCVAVNNGSCPNISPLLNIEFTDDGRVKEYTLDSNGSVNPSIVEMPKNQDSSVTVYRTDYAKDYCAESTFFGLIYFDASVCDSGFRPWAYRPVLVADHVVSLKINYSQSELSAFAENRAIYNAVTGKDPAGFNATGEELNPELKEVIVLSGDTKITSISALNNNETLQVKSLWEYTDKNAYENEMQWTNLETAFKNVSEELSFLIQPLTDWRMKKETYAASYEEKLKELNTARIETRDYYDSEITKLENLRDKWITDTYGYALSQYSGTKDNSDSVYRKGREDWKNAIDSYKTKEFAWYQEIHEKVKDFAENPETGEKSYQAGLNTLLGTEKENLNLVLGESDKLRSDVESSMNAFFYHTTMKQAEQIVNLKVKELDKREEIDGLVNTLQDSQKREILYRKILTDTGLKMNEAANFMHNTPGKVSLEDFADWSNRIKILEENYSTLQDYKNSEEGFNYQKDLLAKETEIWKVNYEDLIKADDLQSRVIEKERKLLYYSSEQSEALANSKRSYADAFQNGEMEKFTYYENSIKELILELKTISSNSYDEISGFAYSGIVNQNLSYSRESFLLYASTLQKKTSEESFEKLTLDFNRFQADLITEKEKSDLSVNKISTLIESVFSNKEKIASSIRFSKELENREWMENTDFSFVKDIESRVIDSNIFKEVGDILDRTIKSDTTIEMVLSSARSLISNEMDFYYLEGFLRDTSLYTNISANANLLKYSNDFAVEIEKANKSKSKEIIENMFNTIIKNPEYAYLREAGFSFTLDENGLLSGKRQIQNGEFKIQGDASAINSYSPLFSYQYMNIALKLTPPSVDINPFGKDIFYNSQFSEELAAQIKEFTVKQEEAFAGMFEESKKIMDHLPAYLVEKQNEKLANESRFKSISNDFKESFAGLIDSGHIYKDSNGNQVEYKPLKDDYRIAMNFLKRIDYDYRTGPTHYHGTKEFKGRIFVPTLIGMYPVDFVYGIQSVDIPYQFEISYIPWNMNLNGEGAAYASGQYSEANYQYSQYKNKRINEVIERYKVNDAGTTGMEAAFAVLGGIYYGSGSTSQKFTQSVNHYAQSKMNSGAADAISNATGLPAGLISGLLGGQKLKDAANEYMQSEILNEVSKKTGIPAEAIQNMIGMRESNKKMKQTFEYQLSTAVASVYALPAAAVTGENYDRLKKERASDLFHSDLIKTEKVLRDSAGLAGLDPIKTVEGWKEAKEKGGDTGLAARVTSDAVRLASLYGTGGTGMIGTISGIGVGLSGDITYTKDNKWEGNLNIGLNSEALRAGATISSSRAGGNAFGINAGIGNPAANGMLGFSLTNSRSGTGGSLGFTKNNLTIGGRFEGRSISGGYLGLTTPTGSNSAVTGGISSFRGEGAGVYGGLSSLSGGKVTQSGVLTFNERDRFGAMYTNGMIDRAGGLTNNSMSFAVSQGGGAEFNWNAFQAGGLGGIVHANLDASGNLDMGLNFQNEYFTYTREGIQNNMMIGNTAGSQSDLIDMTDNLVQDQAVLQARADEGKRKYAGIEPEVWNEMSDAEKEQSIKIKSGVIGEHVTINTPSKKVMEALSNFSDRFSGKRWSDFDGWVDAFGVFVPRTCFPAGTKIHKLKNSIAKMKNFQLLPPNREFEELVNIEDIKVNDYVLTKDDRTKKLHYKPVTELFLNKVELLFEIEFNNGNLIQTTWNHPFWIDGKGWIEAKDIKLEDRTIQISGESLSVISIKQVSVPSTNVYNFEVDETHSYFVGTDGVWVHNYDMQVSSNRTTFGSMWDSLFNSKGEGVLDTGSGNYTGRVYRDGGKFFGLFGSTIYHERININTGITEMVNIQPIKGENGQMYRHEISYSRTNNGDSERNDYIWSGNSRNGAFTNVTRSPFNFSNDLIYHQQVITDLNGSGIIKLVGENNLFTSGFIRNYENTSIYNSQVTNTRIMPVDPRNPNPKFPIYSQQDYQVFRNAGIGPLQGNYIMGEYIVSNRVDPNGQDSNRNNFFAISNQENITTPNRYETTTMMDNQAIIDSNYSPLTNMNLSHPYHGEVSSYPAGTFNSEIHQPGGPHFLGHRGIDLLGNVDLFAMEHGIITSISPNNNTLTIKFDSGRRAAYLHASGFARNIFMGQRISAGSYIGRMGNIGVSAGAHLHLENGMDTPTFFDYYGGGQRGCGSNSNCAIR